MLGFGCTSSQRLLRPRSLSFLGSPCQAAAEGKGLPDEATKRLDIGLEAIDRVNKQAMANIVGLKALPPSKIRDSAMATLVEHRRHLAAQKSVLEDVKFMGETNGKPATTTWLVEALNKLARALDSANDHNKQCAGVAKGMA